MPSLETSGPVNSFYNLKPQDGDKEQEEKLKDIKSALKDKFGISEKEFMQAVGRLGTLTDQELGEIGLTMATASQSQLENVRMRKLLGKELGLSQVQIDQVMAIQSMSHEELSGMLKDKSPTGGLDSILNLSHRDAASNTMREVFDLSDEPFNQAMQQIIAPEQTQTQPKDSVQKPKRADLLIITDSDLSFAGIEKSAEALLKASGIEPVAATPNQLKEAIQQVKLANQQVAQSVQVTDTQVEKELKDAGISNPSTATDAQKRAASEKIRSAKQESSAELFQASIIGQSLGMSEADAKGILKALKVSNSELKEELKKTGFNDLSDATDAQRQEAAKKIKSKKLSKVKPQLSATQAEKILNIEAMSLPFDPATATPEQVQAMVKQIQNTRKDQVVGAIQIALMTENMGMSKDRVKEVVNVLKVSVGELDSQLKEMGISDPANATDAQKQKALENVKKTKLQEIGLSPGEVEKLMAVEAMSPKDLQIFLSGDSHSGSIDRLAGLPNHSSKAASMVIVEIGPPHPKMTMVNFIHALVRSLELVMKAKAETQIADALMNQNRLKDILVMTDQKIQQASEANKAFVENLREAIKTLKNMRIMMYTVMAIAVAITIILGAIAIVATAGAAAPVVAAVVAAVIASIGAAIAAMAITIAANEKRRKGESFMNSKDQEALLITLLVIEVISSVVTGGAAIAAKIATTTAKNVAKAVSSVVAKKTAEEVSKEAAEKVIVEASQAAAKRVIAMAVNQVAQGVGRIMNLRQIVGHGDALATQNAENDFESSDKKKNNRAQGEQRKAKVEQAFQRGDITLDVKQSKIARIDRDVASQDLSDKTAMINSYKEAQRSQEEKVGWIIMGVTLLATLGTAFMSDGGSSAAGAAVSRTIQVLIKLIQALNAAMSAGTSIAQGITTIETQQAMIKLAQSSLEIKRFGMALDAIKTMLDQLKSNADELMTKGQDSLKRSVEALSGAVDSHMKAIESINLKI